jgi:hypothetical protein
MGADRRLLLVMICALRDLLLQPGMDKALWHALHAGLISGKLLLLQ